MVMTIQEKVAEFNRRVSENPDLVSAPAEKLFNAETDLILSSALAESRTLCGMKVRPPSIGVIMLLSCINSPFVTGEVSSAGLKDVIETLFIIKYRNIIAEDILLKKETDMVLARLEHDARTNPELYAIYIDKIMTRKPTNYEHLLAEFSEGVGAFPLAESIISIGRYLGEPVKKNSRRKIFFGLLETFQRFPEKIFSLFCGK